MSTSVLKDALVCVLGLLEGIAHVEGQPATVASSRFMAMPLSGIGGVVDSIKDFELMRWGSSVVLWKSGPAPFVPTLVPL
ncbi:hypothetical protein HAX54_031989 [Datura stramonium]|uniref:Uncharacterized protein n=1 Tax=Datura stramonium TaxID=4076 RepID=A0ABS8SCI0_DATST|nr:hypothetical protein [Datura stramonium]